MKKKTGRFSDWFTTQLSRLAERDPRFYKLLGATISLVAILCSTVSAVVLILMSPILKSLPRWLVLAPFALYFASTVVELSKIGAQLFFHARKCLAPDWEEVRRRDTRRPVLYFRAFSMDASVNKPSYASVSFGAIHRTSEEYLVRSLDEIGPVLAIGQPGESVPPGGAHRVYVDDSDWQSTVKTLIEESQLLVFNLSLLTDNVWWEWETAIQATSKATGIILYLPKFERNYSFPPGKYEELRVTALKRFGLHFPSYDEKTRLFRLCNHGVVLPLRSKSRPWWRAELDPNNDYYELVTALSPFMHRIGIVSDEDCRLRGDLADWIADHTRSAMSLGTVGILLAAAIVGAWPIIQSLISRIL